MAFQFTETVNCECERKKKSLTESLRCDAIISLRYYFMHNFVMDAIRTDIDMKMHSNVSMCRQVNILIFSLSIERIHAQNKRKPKKYTGEIHHRNFSH